MIEGRKNNKNSFEEIIGFILLGGILMFIVGLIVSSKISFSCEYHEPINKEQSRIFDFFFDIISGHPESNGNYWLFTLFCGILIGFSMYKLRQKKLETETASRNELDAIGNCNGRKH